MEKKVTTLEHLRAAALETQGVVAEVASAAVAAIEEIDQKKQDADTAVTMEAVNAAIYAAITGAIQAEY